MDDGISFLELMEQKMLWEDWYTRRFSGPSADALSREDQRLLHMDPNKLLDPGLLAYLRRQLQG
jgi:hypothetical protein